MFLTLEALVIGLATSKPTADDLTRLDILEELAAERGSDLLNYVRVLRERCAGPGLTERFRRLALRLFPDEPERRLSDAEAFEELNRLRNRLLHPSRDYRELNLHESERANQATPLAQRYLLAAFTRG